MDTTIINDIIKSKNMDQVSELIDLGQLDNIDDLLSNGETWLTMAAQYGNPSHIEKLFNAGADHSVTNGKNSTVRQVALKSGKLENYEKLDSLIKERLESKSNQKSNYPQAIMDKINRHPICNLIEKNPSNYQLHYDAYNYGAEYNPYTLAELEKISADFDTEALIEIATLIFSNPEKIINTIQKSPLLNLLLIKAELEENADCIALFEKYNDQNKLLISMPVLSGLIASDATKKPELLMPYLDGTYNQYHHPKRIELLHLATDRHLKYLFEIHKENKLIPMDTSLLTRILDLGINLWEYKNVRIFHMGDFLSIKDEKTLLKFKKLMPDYAKGDYSESLDHLFYLDHQNYHSSEEKDNRVYFNNLKLLGFDYSMLELQGKPGNEKYPKLNNLSGFYLRVSSIFLNQFTQYLKEQGVNINAEFNFAYGRASSKKEIRLNLLDYLIYGDNFGGNVDHYIKFKNAGFMHSKYNEFDANYKFIVNNINVNRILHKNDEKEKNVNADKLLSFIDINKPNEKGLTYLMVACKDGEWHLIDFLLNKLNADPLLKDNKDNNALHYLSNTLLKYYKHREGCDELIAKHLCFQMLTESMKKESKKGLKL